MRRKDRETSQADALAVVDTCVYAALATADAEGTPYCVPISIVRDGSWIAFHCAKEGRKLENMRQRPRVCIACVSVAEPVEDAFSVRYASAIVEGVGEEVTDEAEKIRLLRLLSERHTPGIMDRFDAEVAGGLGHTAVYRVAMEVISGKARR